ncbi:solute carrier family 12 member 2 [Nematostella vectensis]|uniref:solute carrier family 12 member 2 n=1 Tax=Nematostella vectensis TaxID=45351 RepID=UPI0013901974|nr:solute carrier family 12 member 2 [Nematostella vectensis]
MMSGSDELSDSNVKKDDGNSGYENPMSGTRACQRDANLGGQRFSVEQVRGKMREEKHSPVDPSCSSPTKENNDGLYSQGGTIGYATNEAIPMTVFYRNEHTQTGQKQYRPTIQELQKGFEDDTDQQYEELPEKLENGKSHRSNTDVKVHGDAVKMAPKFGWLKGVMLRCLLNIWGVMLFLRLTWVVGQSGIIWSTVIIILSALVTTVTTLSMSAVCTNGEVKGGGAYYLISRSLGPEFGGSIGLIFSLANAVAVALYVVGFAETVRDILRENGSLIIDEVNDIRVIGVISVLALLAVTLIGLEWVVRTQMVLLGILLISIVDAIVGSFIGPQDKLSVAQGIVGLNAKTFTTNLLPDYRPGEHFFSVFAVFFPAATGILAGVNISGDLKDAQKAIPKGTLWAILLSTLVYIALAWLAGACILRDASGFVETVVNATANVTMATPPSCPGSGCLYGLINDYQAMEKMSAWGPLVTCGIFAATLSSALASLVGAPKTFQALCKDNIFPYIGYFGIGVGPGEEPRRGYILTFIIAVGFVAVGNLNVIAPVISNFFLMSYALINYAVFAASLGRSPGWRPSFRYYNMWVSLVGALLCVAIMFLINWWAALVTIAIIASLHKYVDIKKPEVNWGSSAQAFTYIQALRFAYRLNNTEDHVKNFRPQCLVLTGAPSSRPNLTYIVSQITKNVGLMVCGQVNVGSLCQVKSEKDWLRERKIRAFHTVCSAASLRDGVQSLLQTAGLGKLKPNTLVIGFKRNWMRAPHSEVEEYVNIINDAFELNYGVAILRVREEFDIDDLDDGDDWMEDDDELYNKSQTSRGKESLSVRMDPDSGSSDKSRSRNVRIFHVQRPLTPESTSLLAEPPTEIEAEDDSSLCESYKRKSGGDDWTSGRSESASVGGKMTSDIDFEFTSGTHCESEVSDDSDVRLRNKSKHLAIETDFPSSSMKGEVGSLATELSGPTVDMDYPSSSTRVEIGSLTTIDTRDRYGSTISQTEPSEGNESQSFTLSNDRPSQTPPTSLKHFPGDERTPPTSLKHVPGDEQTSQVRFSSEPSSTLRSVTFKGKQKGTVDVWWLFDDGGLTILIPYLLTLHSLWKGCRLRIFTPGSSNIKNNEIRMANLLKKFRIDFSSIEVVHGIDKAPSNKSVQDFRRLPIKEELDEGVQLDKRILRQIRIGELLRQHSKDARLIVMTLPVPKPTLMSPLMYMSWLEVLSADLPPVFLIRGNQTSVLTFYC